MTILTIALPEADRLHAAARDRDVETCAVGLVHPVGVGDSMRYVVRELLEVPERAYGRRTAVAAQLTPEYCTEISNRARLAGAGVLLSHTHPGKNTLEGFSEIDDEGERPLAAYFGRRMPQAAHFAAVFTAGHVHARRLGGTTGVQVKRVGRALLNSARPDSRVEEIHDRQVRAFGQEGQRTLAALTVAVVGLGGTGSVVVQQLAHLGVGSLVLIDPDVLESTNLNRVVGATPGDIGSHKVDIAARMIKAINPEVQTTAVVGDVTYAAAALRLATVDFIFGCTDSMASRAVMNQLAYQYLIPFVDVGVGIAVHDGKVQYITGRTQMLAPGLPCLVCTDKLDAEQVRRELLTEEQRKQDPYITGAAIPQPAVISLNSTMSSAAVTMFLAAVTGIRSDARMLIYDGVRGSLRPAAGPPRPHCIVCSTDGAFGRGQTWRLPTRQEDRNG
jgi:molybdopterin/thiamine biosynthesis adenylyltransferase